MKGKHHGGFAYTTRADVERFHGVEWANKLFKAMGIGTCPVIDGEPGAVFHHDYLRFADVVDSGKPTYFD